MERHDEDTNAARKTLQVSTIELEKRAGSMMDVPDPYSEEETESQEHTSTSK